jgi:hypothetical protein
MAGILEDTDLDALLEVLLDEKFNPYHKPAGTPEGGQFTTGDEGEFSDTGQKRGHEEQLREPARSTRERQEADDEEVTDSYEDWKMLSTGRQRDALSTQPEITDEEELNAVQLYVDEDWKVINAYARDGEYGVEQEVVRQFTGGARRWVGIEDEEEFYARVNEETVMAEFNMQLLDKVIDRSEIPVDVVAYRGLDLTHWGIDPEDIANDPNSDEGLGNIVDHLNSEHVGGTYSDAGFMSVSHSRQTALNFARGRDIPAMLEIRVPAGSNALYIDAQPVGGGERELLFPRNTRLRIVGVSRTSDIVAGRANMIVIAEVIRD